MNTDKQADAASTLSLPHNLRLNSYNIFHIHVYIYLAAEGSFEWTPDSRSISKTVKVPITRDIFQVGLQQYVYNKFWTEVSKVSTAFRFRVSRNTGQTDGLGATLYRPVPVYLQYTSRLAGRQALAM